MLTMARVKALAALLVALAAFVGAILLSLSLVCAPGIAGAY